MGRVLSRWRGMGKSHTDKCKQFRQSCWGWRKNGKYRKVVEGVKMERKSKVQRLPRVFHLSGPMKWISIYLSSSPSEYFADFHYSFHNIKVTKFSFSDFSYNCFNFLFLFLPSIRKHKVKTLSKDPWDLLVSAAVF